MGPNLHWRMLLVPLAIALVVVLVPAGVDDARAAHTDCHEERNHPLWITDVDVSQEYPWADDTYLPGDGAAFVEPGTDLVFDVEIENRYDDPACPGDTGYLTDDLKLQLRYLDIRGEDVQITEKPVDGCPGTRTEAKPGQTCTETIRLPTSVDDEVQPAATDSGEQRVRFVVYDDDARYDAGTDTFEGCAEDDSIHTGPAWLRDDVGACAGAERILVVDKLPDLAAGDVSFPGEQPRTHYTDTPLTAEIEVENPGSYPNWNPNGAGAVDREFWPRSSFDANGDGHPEESRDSESDRYPDQHTGPPCNREDTHTEWPLNTDARCSYRRGIPLQLPIWYEVTRHDGSLVAQEVEPFYSSAHIESAEVDKHLTILPGESDSREVEAMPLYKRAGEHELSLHVDRDMELVPEGEYFDVPESDENNNDLDATVDVIGVDLAISHPRLVVQTPEGASTCPASDPCPVEGSTIRYDPRYENVGDHLDPQLRDELLDRRWRGAVYLDGDLVDYRNQTDVPEADEAERSMFDLPRELTPKAGGGPHTIEIRLDHPGNYATADWSGIVDDPQGVVGERTERSGCPSEGDSLDNTYCHTFHFDDVHPPDIEATRIVTESGTDAEPPEVVEGENVTFEAEIRDDSLVSVTARFLHPNGTPAELAGPDGETFSQLEMTPEEDEDRTWTVETNLRGNLGTYVYKVQAEDADHTVTSTGLAFDLVGLPKDVTREKFRVNGDASVYDSPSRYRGTADDPANHFNLSVNVTGTGHAGDDLADHVSVEVRRPAGTTAAWADVRPIEKCMVAKPPGSSPTEREGEDCRKAEESELAEVESEWTEHYTNSTDEVPTGGGIELAWVGAFDVVVHVEDRFERNATFATTGRIADRLNADGGVEPILENGTLSPASLDPGETLDARIEAYDVLRVETVTLNVTKPGGSTVQAPLALEAVQDARTRNGTYAASFEVGRHAAYLDQGGTYDVHLAAEDFAGHVGEDGTASLHVNDTDVPTIAELATIPGEEQRVGDPITWIAQIEDQTAIQPPVLRVDRPSSGPTGPLEMQRNETAERWELTLETSEVDVGIWTYELTVEDYTGKQATAGGEVEVTENTAPRAENWSPDVEGPDGETYGPPHPTIGVDLVDEDGVNRTTITLSIDGKEITDDAQISEIDRCEGCYRIAFTPEDPFTHGATVSAAVAAEDLSEPPKASGPLRHAFQVDGEAPLGFLAVDEIDKENRTPVVGVDSSITVGSEDGDSGPATSPVTVQRLVDGSPVESQSLEAEDGLASFRLPELEAVFDGEGDYDVVVEPHDAVGNVGEPTAETVRFEFDRPLLTNASAVPDRVDPGEEVQLSVDARDDVPVEQVTAVLEAPDGDEERLEMRPVDGPTADTTDATWSVHVDTGPNETADQAGTFQVEIEAVDADGNGSTVGGEGFTVNATGPFADPPSPPQNLTADVDGTRAQLAWTAPSDDGGAPVDHYTVYRATSPCLSFEPVGETGPDDRTFAQPDLERGQTYCYHVTATNTAGEGEGSEPVTVEISRQPANLAVGELAIHDRTLETFLGTPPVPNPWAGKTLTVDVANDGASASDLAVEASVTACPERSPAHNVSLEGRCEHVENRTIPRLQPGDGVRLETSWSTLGKAGDWELCVHLEPLPSEPRIDDNEVCKRTFVVAGGTGLGGIDATDASQPAS